MAEHICLKCKRIFKQKSHLIDHMNKKFDCSLSILSNTYENEIILNDSNSITTRTKESIEIDRETVLANYNSAVKENARAFYNKNDPKATSEYIYENQKIDANEIVNKLYYNNKRVISIQKKTKVGADGLMIEIAKLLTTHPDDNFVVSSDNIRILTGMSNADWEKNMKLKAPNCFKDKIFHHGKLSKSELMNIKNAIIIIDEIDTGDKEWQVLHNTLEDAGILDVKHMKENNNRFIFISATMIRELYDLYCWGELHELYNMTIPTSYIGHKYFLDKGFIKEFYPLTTTEKVEQWIKEDIIDNYGSDYRVHIVRVNTKTVKLIKTECIRNGIIFRNHTSDDRLTPAEEKEFFIDILTKHIVLGVKGFYRRANLIPNKWKLRIGATHELYTKNVDYSVQIQGLTGRMTGYWKNDIEGGHKTGPHRTSILAIKRYEEIYSNPYGNNSYKSAGFNKKNGKVSAEPTMINVKNIKGIDAVDLPIVENNNDPTTIPIVISVTSEDFNTITKDSRSWNITSILNIIKKYSNDTYDIIKNMEKNQVVQPDTELSYDKLITTFVKASEQNIRCTWATGNKKTLDTYQIYLDNRSYRIIVSIYYGSKIIVL